MNHEKTRIYEKSMELNRACAAVIGRMPSGMGSLADQIRRAGSSVTLTFAEGCKRTSAKERRHFFTIAAASAAEVSAAVDVANAYNAARDEDVAAIKDMCDHLSAMLRLFR